MYNSRRNLYNIQGMQQPNCGDVEVLSVVKLLARWPTQPTNLSKQRLVYLLAALSGGE